MKIIATAIMLAASFGAAAKDVRIAFYGDSTAYGSAMDADGKYYRTSNNEPDQLEWLLQKQFGARVFVENHGVPGAKCPDFLWGKNAVRSKWEDEMKSVPADIVVMNVGLNDPGVYTMGDFRFCYTQLMSIARANGKIFVVATVNPVDKHFNGTYWSTTHIQQWMRDQYKVPLIDHWTETMYGSENWRAMLPDQIHPNDEFYGIKAARSARVLAPIVKAAGGF